MKNIIWKKAGKEWHLYRIKPAQYICNIVRYNGRYVIPYAWFGITKKYNRKSKATLAAAKSACEKWLMDFIKSFE